jgi:archaellum component FlaC
MNKITKSINKILDSKNDYDFLVVNAIINQNKHFQNKLSRIKALDYKIKDIAADLIQNSDDIFTYRDMNDKLDKLLESLSKDIQNWIKKNNKSYMAIMNSLIEEGRKLLGE